MRLGLLCEVIHKYKFERTAMNSLSGYKRFSNRFVLKSSKTKQVIIKQVLHDIFNYSPGRYLINMVFCQCGVFVNLHNVADKEDVS